MTATTDTTFDSSELIEPNKLSEQYTDGDEKNISITRLEVSPCLEQPLETNKLIITDKIIVHARNERDSLSVEPPEDVMDEDSSSEYIKKKKLSLTLPLLNVVVTDTTNACSDDQTTATTTKSVADAATSSTNKKIYESDDNFIQTIFSQTIKSTTATPTDDDQSYAFDDFKRASISSTGQNKTDSNTDDTPGEKLESPIVDDLSVPVANLEGPNEIDDQIMHKGIDENIKSNDLDKGIDSSVELLEMIDDISPPLDEPVAMFTYFHQTIDEDEPPFVIDINERPQSASTVSDDISLTANGVIDISLPTSNIFPILTNDNVIDVAIINQMTPSNRELSSKLLSSVKHVDGMSENDHNDGSDGDADENENANPISIDHRNASIDNVNTATATSYEDASTEEQTESLTSNNTSLHSSVDRADSRNGTEQNIAVIEKSSVEKTANIKKPLDGEVVTTGTTKKKSKKSKKSTDSEKENISVRSSFSKFDALQKQNIANVRTGDAVKINGTPEPEKICRACNKIVYKMEEMKAEKSIWHKNCFRCSECSKPLSVDTFESHEGVLYCKIHFKSLFSPKAVEDKEPDVPRKPELIIRESQPIELPPDVVRSSDKTDLGLTELQQLNVKERYQVFENRKQDETQQLLNRQERTVKRGTTILSKLAKFKAKGMDIGTTEDAVNDIPADQLSGDEDDEEYDENGDDIDLIRAKEAQRERPICLANMDDIKSRFETGHSQSREERREERKQEIQSIRSRLFMGKQAKIKEMYQQAVAESEQCVRASNKKPEVDIGDKARSIKNKFESGEAYKDEQSHQPQTEDSAVFEHGLGKQSRSIFMEIDAKASASPQLTPASPTPGTPKRQISQVSSTWPPPPKDKTFNNAEDVVKYDEKVDEVKIQTADISSKFKFFETYKPTENEKKPFRITPPRDGVVKLPEVDPENDGTTNGGQQNGGHKYIDASAKAAQKSSTTTKMLSMFRQMEETERTQQTDEGLKPLKSFTPPPDDSRRFTNRNSESDSECTDSEDEEDDDEDQAENDRRNVDESLRQAQAAARARQLRAKFERWETKEIQREQNTSSVQLYDGEDQSQTENTKSIRAKFESLRDTPSSPSRERIQVNRFV